MSLRIKSLFLLSLFAFLSIDLGLSRAADAPAETAAPAPAVDPQRLMRLGPGDSVSIEVYGQPDMTTTGYVGDDGKISVPLAGPVLVNGLSPVEASSRTEKALKEGGFFVDPHVNINLVQSRSQRVSVLGEVKQPGRYSIEPDTSIFELLAQAGGATENGADVGYIVRKDAQGNVNRYPVDLKNANIRKGPLQTMVLKGGDELEVPHVEQFYIYGEVSQPSMYRIEPGMTVIQAIARAGGITPRGSEHRVQIKRVGPDGKFIVAKARPGDPVLPNDVIYVKESIF